MYSTYIHTCMHACIHPYIHTSIHPYIHPSIHTYIHTYPLNPYVCNRLNRLSLLLRKLHCSSKLCCLWTRQGSDSPPAGSGKMINDRIKRYTIFRIIWQILAGFSWILKMKRFHRVATRKDWSLVQEQVGRNPSTRRTVPPELQRGQYIGSCCRRPRMQAHLYCTGYHDTTGNPAT